MHLDARTEVADGKQIGALVVGAILPPLGFLLTLTLGYVLSPACMPAERLGLHVVHGMGLGLSLVGGALAWSGRRTKAPGRSAKGGRVELLAAMGFLSAGLFSLVALAQWVPILLEGSCW